MENKAPLKTVLNRTIGYQSRVNFNDGTQLASPIYETIKETSIYNDTVDATNVKDIQVVKLLTEVTELRLLIPTVKTVNSFSQVG